MSGSKAHVETLQWASHYASQLRFVHVLSLLFLAFAADYAWVLYMRWRMVRAQKSRQFHGSSDQAVATGSISMANLWQHIQSSERKALVLLRETVKRLQFTLNYILARKV
jgi:23S rRNA maturation mini-RNase III